MNKNNCDLPTWKRTTNKTDIWKVSVGSGMTAPSHYLSQPRPRSTSSYGLTRPQKVNYRYISNIYTSTYRHNTNNCNFIYIYQYWQWVELPLNKQASYLLFRRRLGADLAKLCILGQRWLQSDIADGTWGWVLAAFSCHFPWRFCTHMST